MNHLPIRWKRLGHMKAHDQGGGLGDRHADKEDRVPWRCIHSCALRCAPEGQTAEYAFTTYPLGGLAFNAGITPPPGFYVTDVTSFYDGTIGGNFNFGGRTFDAGVRAQIFVGETNLLYVPDVKVFDGLIGFSLTVPTACVDYTAKATGPFGSRH